MYSYGFPHMAAQKQDDQLERTFSSYVRIQVVVLKTYLGRWTIGRSGERGSGISVLPARYDDDDDEIHHGKFSVVISCLNFRDKAWWFFFIKGFQTIVFIFIVISSTFRPIYLPAFFRCLSNSRTYTELRTMSFVESTGVVCSNSISHNQIRVLSIPVLLLTCSQDWTCNLQMIISLEA